LVAGLGVVTARIGPQAGPLLQWLYAGLRESGLAVELMETRHVRDAFKAMAVKTDRKDAQETLVAMADALLLARATFAEHLGKLQKRLVSLASDDTRARLLMSTSGVGVHVALTYVVPIESRAVQIIQRCWSPFRHDAKEVSIRRHRCHRMDLEDRGRVRTHRALRSRHRHSDETGKGILAEKLGDASGKTCRYAQGKGGAGTQARPSSGGQ
jgi:hypothetical protein